MRSLLLSIVCFLLLFGCQAAKGRRDSSPTSSLQMIVFVTPESAPEANEFLLSLLEVDLRSLPGLSRMETRCSGKEIRLELHFKDFASRQESLGQTQQLVHAFSNQHPQLRLKENDKPM